MEARLIDSLPDGDGWQYEPKWDGFRCLAFRDGDDIAMMSKSGKPLDRYFPELVAALREMPERRFVVDGEIVLPIGGILSFEALQARLHPAASRIARLSQELRRNWLCSIASRSATRFSSTARWKRAARCWSGLAKDCRHRCWSPLPPPA